MTTQKSAHFTPENTDEFIRRTFYSNQVSEEDIRRAAQKHNIADVSQVIRSAVHWYAQCETVLPPSEPVVPKRGRPAKK